MKSQEETNADIGLEERSPILQAWKNLKDSIFNVLFVLLDKNDDEQEESFYRIAFETGLDYLQMLAFPFDDSVIAVWNGGQTLENVSALIGRLNISTYLPGVSFEAFLVMVYALVLLIILVLIDIIYVSYSFSKKKFRFTWPLVLLAQIVPLFVTIFFLPITETLISVVRCGTHESGDYQYMISFPDVICWEGWHLFHAAVTLLFSSLFVFISSVVALALFEPRMTTNKLAARQNSTGQVVFIMNKIICQLVFSFTPFSENWVYALMLFILSGWLYWTYNMNDPFYNKKVSKFFRLMSSYYFWTNFMLLASQVLSLTGFNGGLVIWLSGLPFIGVIIIFDQKSNINKLFSSNLKFKSGEELDTHLTYVLQLLQNRDSDKNSYMLLIGYIQKHKQICLEDDCPLRVTKKKTSSSNNDNSIDIEEACQRLIKQLERMYKVGIKKYPGCTKLCLSFAFFRLERTKNKNKAYEDFSYALKTDPSFEQQFIIYRFKKIIRENLEDDNQQNSSDLIQIIRFENHISLCEQAMILAARLHKQFWTELKEESPDLNKLNEIGFKITQTVKKVKQNFTQVMKINNSVPEMLYNYSMFLILVLKETNEGKKIMEEAKAIIVNRMTSGENKDKEIEMNDLVSGKGEYAMVEVSAKSSNMGIILNTNLFFTEMTGYLREGIVERDMDKLLPDIFQSVHKEKMTAWMEEQNVSSKYMTAINKGFMKQKSGFILPIEYKVNYSADNEVFRLFFKLASEKGTNCHIILNQHGKIIEMSVLTSINLGISREQMLNRKVDFCNYMHINQFLQYLGEKSDLKTKLPNGKKISCEIVVEEVYLELKGRAGMNSFEEEENLLNKEINMITIGYYVELSKFSEEMPEESYSQIDQEKQVDIFQLYEQPKYMDILVENLTQTKNKEQGFQPYHLTFKIKTMRLLNNEIKMVYEQDNEADFNQGENTGEEEDEVNIFKMDDEMYQAKIRHAINTKLDHKEVLHLRTCFIVFLLGLCTLCVLQMLFSLTTLEQYKDKGEKIYNQSAQSNHLSKFTCATFDANTHETTLQSLRNHENSLEDDTLIEIKLKSGEIADKNLTDSFLYMYSLLTEYMETNNSNTLDIVYENYVKYLYPIIGKFIQPANTMLIPYYVSVGLTVCFGLVVLIVWVLIRLLIDRKKFNIMLWFLDIPIPYVTFLSEHCDRYLKNFLGSKELMEKGINFDNTDVFMEEYDEEQKDEQQVEQQQKTRKILIIKQRKQSLVSKLNCSYWKMCWIFLFSLVYPLVTFSYLISVQQNYRFIADQWVFSGKQINWSNYFHFSMYMIQRGESTIADISMNQFMEENRKHFLNMISHDALYTFNEEVVKREEDPTLSSIINAYNKVYYKDICNTLSKINVSKCRQVANSAFKGGYNVYRSYLYSAQLVNFVEVREANEEYGAPALLYMMDVWNETMSSLIDSSRGVCQIVFYIYVVLIILGFFIGCLMYLSKLNMELNEGIKMLNMIPFKLLSRSRKETRQFLLWIIRQANKKNHQDD